MEGWKQMAELYTYINTSGVIVPDTENLQSEVEQEYKDTFGEDLDVTPETPQGRLIELDTRMRSEVLQCAASVANVINPNLSYGMFLDAIAALTGCYRKQATRSEVTATLGGTPGTTIPANSLATTEDYSKIFVLSQSVVLDENGTATAKFYSQEYGDVQLAAGELNTIKTGVLGWETIINNSSATVGRNRETDSELKERRIDTLFSGRSFIGDIKSYLLELEGVKSVDLYNNYKLNPVTVKGVTIDPKSVFVCVYGGSDQEIGMALYKSTAPGCGFTGNTNVTVTDPWCNHNYEVSFYRPTEIEIDVKVYVKVATGSGDVTGAIKQAILDYQDGKVENIDGLQIGVEVSPFEIASAINIEVPGVFVQQVQIAKHGMTLSTTSIDITMAEIARISSDNITIRYIS